MMAFGAGFLFGVWLELRFRPVRRGTRRLWCAVAHRRQRGLELKRAEDMYIHFHLHMPAGMSIHLEPPRPRLCERCDQRSYR